MATDLAAKQSDAIVPVSDSVTPTSDLMTQQPDSGNLHNQVPALGDPNRLAAGTAAGAASDQPSIARKAPTVLHAAERSVPAPTSVADQSKTTTTSPTNEESAVQGGGAGNTNAVDSQSGSQTIPQKTTLTAVEPAEVNPSQPEPSPVVGQTPHPSMAAGASDPENSGGVASKRPVPDDASQVVASPGHPLRAMAQPAAAESESSRNTQFQANPLRKDEQAPRLLPQFQSPPQPTDTASPLRTSPPAALTRPAEPAPGQSVAGQDATGSSTVVAEVAVPAASSEKKQGHGEFDPIKENGEIFVDWPTAPPRLALVISGRQEGYLEPCGCAGLDRMKGGVSRRHMLIRQLREQKRWPLVTLDVGALSKGFGKQAELKFHTTFEAYRRMGYSAIGLGLSDLRLPAGELLSVTAAAGDQKSPFVSANVGLFTFDPPMVEPYQVVQAGGVRIGVTAVLGKQYQQDVRNDEVLLALPEEKLPPVVSTLKSKADYLILLAFATIEESTALSRKFPDFQMVVTAGGAPEPPARPEIVDPTRALLIEVGEKGMNVIVVALYDDPQHPYRYQRVPLDSRFPNSPDMRTLMASYQDRLKDLGFTGLGLRPVPHPQHQLNGRFVGSEKCESCHDASYKIWKKSGHAKAYQTLVQADPPRHFDPECISCHVIGWNPQKYFPYESGFWSQQTTPKMIDVGCEACHGPGEAHVAAEMGANAELQTKLQKAMVVSKEDSQKHLCVTCHDLDNSPDFKFETYWPKVEHYEKE